MSVFWEILLIDLIFFPECDFFHFFHFFHFFVPENLRKALWPSRLKLLIVAWPKVTKRGQSLEGEEAKGFLGMKKGGNLNFALRKLFCTLKLVAFDAFLLVLRRSFCEAQDQSACKIWKGCLWALGDDMEIWISSVVLSRRRSIQQRMEG